jgi:hypothetical protein
LTAASCPKKDVYTPPKKHVTDFNTAHSKKCAKKQAQKSWQKSQHKGGKGFGTLFYTSSGFDTLSHTFSTYSALSQVLAQFIIL